MSKLQVFSPEWLAENDRLYNENADLQDILKKLTVKMAYRVTADSKWDIGEDLLWCTFFEKGALTKMCILTQAEVDNEADFLLSAPPETWAKLLRRNAKFGTELTVGRVKVVQGSKLGVLKVAPYSKHVITLLTQADTVYPDEAA